MSDLRQEEREAVVVLTLDRPARRNALSRGLIAELSDALDTLEVQPTLRAVIVAATGPVFCAGLDLKEAAALGEGTEGEDQGVPGREGVRSFDLADSPRFRSPIIAALQGNALAGGAGLALSCDFVVMATTARLGYPEVLRGLVPGDRLARPRSAGRRPSGAGPGAVGPDDRRGGSGALGAGQPGRSGREHCLDEARALADVLLAAAPSAVSTTKRLIDEAVGRPSDLRGAASLSAAARVGEEAIEGMRAFLEKRPARWALSSEPKSSDEENAP